MNSNSLAFRLIASSAAIAIVLLVAAAFLINSLFYQALERNFDSRLRAVLDGLIANVEVADDGAPAMTQPLADARFSLPLSGWYWQVRKPSGDETQVLTSASLLETRLKPNASDLRNRNGEGVAAFYMADSEGKSLRAIEQKFKLFGSEEDYEFIVAGNFDELSAEVAAFRRILYGVLTLLGLGLIAATLAQVIFGLRPLKAMQAGLNAIREGKAEKLEGNFPSEIQPVATELNLLIGSNAEVLERARTQVGNLAHALKTPLSVLTNEAASNPSLLATRVSEQTEIMRTHVNLYLDRARRAARAGTLGAAVEVEPVAAALVRTLLRINKDRNLVIEANVSRMLKFRGERQDLEEMLGNLLDNACKWGKSHVTLTARTSSARNGRPFLELAVDDDGPGIPEERRAAALQRGARLDESMPGSGLGLNIVQETSAMYGGVLQLEQSPLGGLRAALLLPSVQT
jgi:signal transduction histidine kinase